MPRKQPSASDASLNDMAPSDRELDLLKALWQLGEGTVRQVLEIVAPQGELAFNTVQTQLRIMEDKKFVSHRAEGRTFIYRPLYSRDTASSRFLNKVFDGAISDLVMTLVNSQHIPASELRELEDLISQTRKQLKGRSSRSASGKEKS
jgi:predicted transcriptional regulator